MALAKETIPPGEAKVIQALAEDNLPTVGAPPRRGQHAKAHGLVQGKFRVLDDLPDGFGLGVFQPGRAYRCQVRFSNGKEQDDTKDDVRGMAIKLLDVAGPKLLPGRGDASEQDFILVDHPTYFTASMAEYASFNRLITPLMAMRASGFSPLRAIRAGYGLALLILRHRGILRAAKTFAGRRAGNPLSLTYHSATPYLFGEECAVKYKAIGRVRPTAPTTAQNGLRQALWATLKDHPAIFDFGVVVQADADCQPIEDASIDWELAGARFVKIAELTIPQQTNNQELDAGAETIRFSPWMALAEHRPLGHINRARREIYRAMSRLRRRKSH